VGRFDEQIKKLVDLSKEIEKSMNELLKYTPPKPSPPKPAPKPLREVRGGRSSPSGA